MKELVTEKIPWLSIEGIGNNPAKWLKIVEKRYTEVYKHNKAAMPNLLFTLKQNADNLKCDLDTFQSIGGLFEYIKVKLLGTRV